MATPKIDDTANGVPLDHTLQLGVGQLPTPENLVRDDEMEIVAHQGPDSRQGPQADQNGRRGEASPTRDARQA